MARRSIFQLWNFHEASFCVRRVSILCHYEINISKVLARERACVPLIHRFSLSLETFFRRSRNDGEKKDYQKIRILFGEFLSFASNELWRKRGKISSIRVAIHLRIKSKSVLNPIVLSVWQASGRHSQERTLSTSDNVDVTTKIFLQKS